MSVFSDGVHTIAYPTKTEAPVTYAIEDTCELLSFYGKVNRSTYVVITLLAPIIQFVAKNPSIGLADEHVVVLLETVIEFFAKTEGTILRNSFKELLVEKFATPGTSFSFHNSFVVVQQASFVCDEYYVVFA
jgi:hypothetical protein